MRLRDYLLSKRKAFIVRENAIIMSQEKYDRLKERASQANFAQKDMIRFVLNLYHSNKFTYDEANKAATKAGFTFKYNDEYGHSSIIGDGKERVYDVKRGDTLL